MNMSVQRTDQRVTYIADLFVGRQAQIDKVLAKAAQICQTNSEPDSQRVTIFGGEVGLGKTWLLQRIMQLLREPPYNEKIVVYNLDLSDRRRAPFAPYNASEHLLDILRKYAEVVLNTRIQQETLPAASRQVIEATQRFAPRWCLGLFIDEVFEADWEFLELFEEYLLGPLAIEPHVLITMAGRGHWFPFATPELRLYAETETLQPFQVAETRALVAKVNQTAIPQVERIQAISQGVPLTAAYLARHPQVAVTPDAASLDTMIEYMLAPIPADLRSSVRAYVEALSVLSAFDDERVQTLVGAYLQTERAKVTLPEVTQIPPSNEVLRLLVHQGIARYELDLGAYVNDEHLRLLVMYYLQACEADQRTWRMLHTAAHAMYTKWAAKYDSGDRWQAEIDYHQASLSTPDSQNSN